MLRHRITLATIIAGYCAWSSAEVDPSASRAGARFEVMARSIAPTQAGDPASHDTSRALTLDAAKFASAWLGRAGSRTEGRVEEVARAVAFSGGDTLFVVGTLASKASIRTTASATAVSIGSFGGTDAFVAALNLDGSVRWSLALGGSAEDYAYDVEPDGSGGAWICGTFNGTARFGSSTLIAQGSGPNGFAMRVSDGGSTLRVIHVGPAAGVIPGECAVDASGGLVVTGSYTGAPRISGVQMPRAPSNQSAGFVVSYASDGSTRWVNGVAASVGLAWRGVTVAGDGSGDVVGVGQFQGSVSIGSNTLTSSGGSGPSTWVARWTPSGQPLWAMSPSGESYGRGVQALGADLIVSGALRGLLTWPGAAPAASNGGRDLFAARLSGAGLARWVRAVGGASEDEGAEVAIGAGGDVFLAGSLSGQATIGSSILGSSGARDLLLARLSNDGNPIEGQLIGGTGDDVGYALDVSGDGRIAYTGFGRGTVDDGSRSIVTLGAIDAVFGLVDYGVGIPKSQSVAVTIPQRGGGTLSARIFAPSSPTQRYPVISMLPGGGAPIDSVFWAATGLADSGYVVIVTQPSSGGSLSAYHTAAISGIDYLRSSSSPYASISDGIKVGVAGWSLGARALSRTQEEDTRVDALVAWDNLAVIESGDVGSPNCQGTVPSSRRTPRIPSMGQASDYCGPPNETVEDKKYAYEWWRTNAQPTMQVVLANSDHFVWGSQGNGGAKQAYALYYTAAWFDRWLKGDTAATDRLLARSINGVSLGTILSSRFRSAASFDSYDCPNLRSRCSR
jgi:hypothetical protein